MISHYKLGCVLLLSMFQGFHGCTKEQAGAKGNADAVRPFVLASEPAGAVEVVAARAAAKPGEAVVVHGRVQEFVDGLAAFTLVDASLQACNEKAGAMDSCATPWDFCCDDPKELAKQLVSVEIRGAGRAPLAASLIGNLGFDHLKHVVVKGKAETDAKGNVTIVADGIFVRS